MVFGSAKDVIFIKVSSFQGPWLESVLRHIIHVHVHVLCPCCLYYKYIVQRPTTVS